MPYTASVEGVSTRQCLQGAWRATADLQLLEAYHAAWIAAGASGQALSCKSDSATLDALLKLAQALMNINSNLRLFQEAAKITRPTSGWSWL